MKKYKIKNKVLAISVIVSLFVTCLFKDTTMQSTCTAIAPNAKDIVAYYSQRLPQKQQRINGPCWAFAGIATLETFLCKKGLFKESLSEKHLLSWANQASNMPGWHIPITRGGHSAICKGYLMSRAGPVSNKTCPYTTGNDTFTPRTAACKPLYWVKGIKDVDTNVSAIKKAISDYGSVAIVYPASANFNHAVAAIGWDDNTKEWITKNSAAHSNYSRLPFSTKILDSYCITDAECLKPNHRIYQYDKYGVTGGICSENRLTVANVFDFSGNETLDSVTIYSMANQAKLTLYCAPTNKHGIPYGNCCTWIPLYIGIIPYSGYSTFKLQRQPKLDKNTYAIIAQIEKNESSTRPSIGYQNTIENLTLSANSTNRSFIFRWPYFTNMQSTNKYFPSFSIKAITLVN